MADSPEYLIRGFKLVWFTMVMGTGIVSILILNFPYGDSTAPSKDFSAVFFFLNLVFFVLLIVGSTGRLLSGKWLDDPGDSIYLGALLVSGDTLINDTILLLHGAYKFGGVPFVYVVWGLWWLDVAASTVCCWSLVRIIAVKQDYSLASMSLSWLFPAVTLVATSSSGGLLAQALRLISPTHALLTVTLAAVILFIGLTLSLTLLGVYFYKLIVFGHPKDEAVITSFMPLGAMGQAGFSFILIGDNFTVLLPAVGSGSASMFLGDVAVGKIIRVACVCTGFMLWSLTTMWFAYALLAFYLVLRRSRLNFQPKFWGMIYPIGAYGNLTIALSRILDNANFFRIWGAICACFTLMLWLFVFVHTLQMWTSVFAPTLVKLLGRPEGGTRKREMEDQAEQGEAAGK
ncbi:C4-dicarboxylate transporter [Heterobasidion irregulare TC 32-1]|uniref:C4-dicarboxylate transporter n=1 Tax=Heterobasidion irregulare (strain TC 32-1) TaxID=747525 RepID=W4K7M7_HETIT|nr:C4-dicarboxylate transporter [Heterobasidion irregulare TC 32-1]ETW81081.1 C4-dicarboxylate transporter [Heterobasidion irregulare TC 32-1]